MQHWGRTEEQGAYRDSPQLSRHSSSSASESSGAEVMHQTICSDASTRVLTRSVPRFMPESQSTFEVFGCGQLLISNAYCHQLLGVSLARRRKTAGSHTHQCTHGANEENDGLVQRSKEVPAIRQG